MSLVNAELTKIAVNTYVTMKISYANTFADMCERLPGADVEVVTDALGLDTRIGRKYLRGAIAYGGPCFPRDNKAFAVLARDLGAEPLLAEATDAVNVAQTDRLTRIVLSRLGRRRRRDPRARLQARHGVIEESPGVALARRWGRQATASTSTTRSLDGRGGEELGGGAPGGVGRRPARTLRRGRDRDALAGVRRPTARRPAAQGQTRVVIDCWRLLSDEGTPRRSTSFDSAGAENKNLAPTRALAGGTTLDAKISRSDPILVAGAGGFIGGWLVRYLHEQGYSNLRAIDIKPLTSGTSCCRGSRTTCRSPLAGGLPDAVRASSSLQPRLRHGRDGVHRGEQGPLHALRADQHASADGRQRSGRGALLLLVVGVRVQRRKQSEYSALREEDAYPALPEDGYGWEKLFSERMCRHFHEDFGLETRVARYHNVYGPHGTYDGGREKAPAAICRKVTRPSWPATRDRDLG